MFKNILMSTGLMALLLSSNAFATGTTLTGTTTVQSEYNYRGKSVSDDASVGVALRASNVLVDGLFVTGETNTLNVTPLNDSRFRSEVGVGYAHTFGKVETEASLNRVFNPILYGDDYTEVRARAGYSYFFVEAAQGLTDGVNRDTYVAIGAEAQLNPRWTGSVKASAVSYNLNDHTSFAWPDSQSTHFNNLEVTTTYNVWRNLDGFLTFSEGGRNFDGSEIKNQLFGGLKYRF